MNQQELHTPRQRSIIRLSEKLTPLSLLTRIRKLEALQTKKLTPDAARQLAVEIEGVRVQLLMQED